ncbi:MAG: nucleotide exchange factor GrpE [Bdellovibrionales bacterium RIFOXYD12_FULL_39_22]|nr:MAG: nucleotide exchange factor GrpE [Bdellovibrionales bacterium RIFOXYB1_FULL_39_21]OFZ42963.1 MAG: nucleotide exchange factor GrpE [Bdellovibrionales bacterium RIFOXYC12_FULL_39_17]OFZ50951.1 MAG: nucleotide exchange factor GrpE [Bdellovibrionales bacterium RIFOXYC1_FULL_39_130]OFZ78174.1 MAG: nucleotide exchange factor GrpE [Bdellovibrionales bacterium RIFOXYD1_FULL_39_84]OFZ94042.1 MAG: nucleotide exchange factor GrpE [Bdellovibrionales bacterium RIFOXYD12_FULL_39_22]HLE10495.1 nucleot
MDEAQASGNELADEKLNLDNEQNDEQAEEVTPILKAPTNEAQEKDDGFKSKYYYLAAEMDNMKKRFEREKDNIVKYGNERILKSMIDIVDDFDRTIDVLKKDNDDKVKNIITGIDMVRKKLTDCLGKNGLEVIESIGKIFDPNFHEAMAMQPADGKQDQEVITEFQKGYLLNGRLLRAAKVIIAKN